jgi:hypothetical protein
MRVGLGVGERLMVLGVLPKEGNFVTLKVIRNLIDKLGLTTEEIEKFEVIQEGGQVTWKQEGNLPIDFDFDNVEVDIIKHELKKMDSENRLKVELLPVYEKFV